MSLHTRRLVWTIATVALGLAMLTTVAYAETMKLGAGFVEVGDVGNEADRDPATGDPSFGSVDYRYQIAKYEVTNGQYTEFLKAVANVNDPYELYDNGMSGYWGGIKRYSVSGGYTYTAKSGREDLPVSFVTWYDALRYANWLHNDQPDTGVQDSSTTEDGAYTFTGLSAVGSRNDGAKFWLPSEDEWYKAAYYDPNYGGPGVGGYYTYATQSNTPPVSEYPETPGGHPQGSANYRDPDFVAPRPRSSPVGSYTNSASAYGTFDQNGNVWEWNEADVLGGGIFRGSRGGSFFSVGSGGLASAHRSYSSATECGYSLGFRVASESDIQNSGPLWVDFPAEPELAHAWGPYAGELSVALTADDLDLPGDTLSYSIDLAPVPGYKFPDGANITKDAAPPDQRHATFTWDPLNTWEVGDPWQDEYRVKLVVTDSFGEIDEAILTIQVVPEPSTVLMLLSTALMGLVIWRRRRS